MKLRKHEVEVEPIRLVSRMMCINVHLLGKSLFQEGRSSSCWTLIDQTHEGLTTVGVRLWFQGAVWTAQSLAWTADSTFEFK